MNKKVKYVNINMISAFYFILSSEINAYQNHNSAMTCDLQQCGILTSEDTNEPVQSPFMLRNSK